MAAKERQKHKPKSVVENLPPQDKARAVKAALKHPNGAKMSDEQLGKHVGVAPNTVRKYRKELESSSQIAEMTTRTVTRGNTTYEQNTANIGKRKEAEPVEEVT